MTKCIELELSNYQIERATARLAYQQAAVRRFGSHVDPDNLEAAKETLELMKSRLARLLVRHADLLEEQTFSQMTAASGFRPFRRRLVEAEQVGE